MDGNIITKDEQEYQVLDLLMDVEREFLVWDVGSIQVMVGCSKQQTFVMLGSDL